MLDCPGMQQDPLGSVGSVPVKGGSVKFTYDAQGNVIATFEDVAYKGDAFERFLHADWRDAVGRATGGAAGDTHARQVAIDDIVSAVRIAEVHREAHDVLSSTGRMATPEAAYLARSVIERLERVRAKYGDIVVMPGETREEGAAASAGKAPAGFEDTPRTYGPDGKPTGYDLSKGFMTPAGFKAWFTYGPDGSVRSFQADARVGMDTLARMFLRPDWNVVFEERVVEVTRRSWLGRLLDLLRRRPKPEPEKVRVEMGESFVNLLQTVFVDGQAVLALERAGMADAYETGYLRRAIDEARHLAVALLGGKDVFQ